ncbi:MAG: glycosyltransferase [Bacteroidetes bacterium]|nr:glycosyltransferase [Bacteroidota bacterium]
MILPKITIITPTFNTAETIETVLLSVAKQTYKNIEHIIVDGASKDKTLPTIRRFQKQHKHIRLLTEKDKGIYDAMNKGMGLCTGDWIIFMGADDSFYNEHVLTELYEQGLFQEEQVIYGNVIIKGDAPWAKDGTIYDGPFTLEKLFKGNICHQSIFYPRSVITQVGYYDTKYKVTSDWDYNVKCWAKYKFTYVDKVIACFTTGGKSSEGGDYALHLDFPGNVIRYFQLDLQDPEIYNVTSPFYYPMARHRENEFISNISELRTETEQLKQFIASRQTEHDESVAALQKQHEMSGAGLRTEFEGILAGLKTGQENFLAAYQAENETYVNNLKGEHEQVLANIKEEHAYRIANQKTEHDQAIAYIKEEAEHRFIMQQAANDQALAQLREENDQRLTALRNEHVEVVSQLTEKHDQNVMHLKAGHEQVIANLTAEHEHRAADLQKNHDQAVINLQNEHAQVVGNLKEEHYLAINNLKNEHNAVVSGLKVEHNLSLNNLKTEHNLVVSNLKLEHGLSVASLKSDHMESMNTLKGNYDEIIISLKAEQLTAGELFRRKEADFTQMIESNNLHIEQLNLAIASHERRFSETVENYNNEIANLKAEIALRNQQIATIFSSYTWKTGKILLSPAVFVAKTFASKKTTENPVN